MDRNDLNSSQELHRLLGELSADMKHVLRSLDAGQAETKGLRAAVSADLKKHEARLDALEKFRTQAMVYGSVLLMLIVPALNFGIPALLKLI